jgi:hypothetical protein
MPRLIGGWRELDWRHRLGFDTVAERGIVRLTLDQGAYQVHDKPITKPPLRLLR